MPKLRYELDPHNRLIANLYGVRRVLEGQFRIGPRNKLIYDIKTPVPQDAKAPHQVKLQGAWSLTKEHNLRFTIDKWQRKTFGDQLTLRGEILSVNKNSLLFALTTRTAKGQTSLYTLELSGAWQADARNRLTFRVYKGGDNFDNLTLEGAWEIDKNYRVIYRYRKEDLVRKKKRVHTLAFEGKWDITDKTRLSYILGRDSNSQFHFKTGLGIFKNNYIKYELGIDITERRRPAKRTITLFGKWGIKKGSGLVFEVERSGRKIQAIVLGAEAKFGEKGTVLFSLRNKLNKEIEGKLELSRGIFKGEGSSFLRLLKAQGEAVIQAGAGRRW